MRITVLICCLVFVLVPAASAQIVINSDVGAIYEADGFTGFNTQSPDMVGLLITIRFADNSVESRSWTATGVSGTGWSMTHGPGSSFSDPFTLTNNSGRDIAGVQLHGGGTTTLFDRDVRLSTAATENGRDVTEVTNLSASQQIIATYFDQIQLTGTSPVGDIYAGLDIRFENGMASGSTFSFITDTDTSTNLLRLAPIPEPGLALWLPLLAGFWLMSRTRRQTTAVKSSPRR